MLPTNPPREPLSLRTTLNPTFYSRRLAERRVRKQAARAAQRGTIAGGVEPGEAISPTAVLPPGTFIGENAAFLKKDGYEFFRRRAERYKSPIFITHIFAEPCMAISGAEEAKIFFDNSRMMRLNANAPHLSKYFFGKGTTSGIDGIAHQTRKAQVLAGFTPEKLAKYTAIWARTVDKYILRWAGLDRVQLREEIFNLHTEFAMAYVLGIFDPTPEAVNTRRQQLVHMIESFGAIPHLRVPGSRIWKVNKARKSLQSWILQLVEEQRQGLRDGDTLLAGIANTRDENGDLLPAELASAEVINHLRPTVIAAYLTTFMMHAFHDHPEVMSRLRADVEELDSEMPAEGYYANKDWLDRLHYGDCIANEVRRYYPCVPLMMARVRHTFEYNGLIFPQGWLVLLGVHGVHRDPRVYSEPDVFAPERFERGEHQRVDERYTILQQSGSDLYTNHKCAGETLTTLMIKSLAARLVRDFTWIWSPKQDFGYSITDIPATPRGGICIERLQPRTSSSAASVASTEQRAMAMVAEDKMKMGRGRLSMMEALKPEPAPIGLMSGGGLAGTAAACPMVAKSIPHEAPPLHATMGGCPMMAQHAATSSVVTH